MKKPEFWEGVGRMLSNNEKNGGQGLGSNQVEPFFSFQRDCLFIPLHPNLTFSIPECYNAGTDAMPALAIKWKFRQLQHDLEVKQIPNFNILSVKS